MVTHFSFDNETDAANDDTGNGHDGSVSNAIWTAGGKSGGAMDFDGNDDWVGVPKTGMGTSAGTVAMWVKQDDSGNGQYIYRGGGSSNRVYLNVATGGELFATMKNENTSHTGELLGSDWRHAVLTWGGGSYDIYLDSEDVGGANCSSSITLDSTMYLGNYADNRTDGFRGMIDEFYLYNRRLNGSEVSDLFNVGVPGSGPIDMPDLNLDLASSGPSTTITLTATTATLGDLTTGTNASLTIAGTDTASFNNVNLADAATAINNGGDAIDLTVRGALQTGASGNLTNDLSVNGDLTVANMNAVGAAVSAKNFTGTGTVSFDGTSSLTLTSSTLTVSSGATTFADGAAASGVTAVDVSGGDATFETGSTLAGSLTSINVSSGSLTTSAGATTATLTVASEDAVLNAPEPLTVTGTADLGSLDLTVTGGGTFSLTGSNLADHTVARTLTLNGGAITTGALASAAPASPGVAPVATGDTAGAGAGELTLNAGATLVDGVLTVTESGRATINGFGGFTSGQDWSVSFWVYNTLSWDRDMIGFGGDKCYIRTDDDDAGGTRFRMDLAVGDLVPGGPYTDISNNAWHHLGIIFNETADTTEFYVDGNLTGTASIGTSNWTLNGNDASLGGWSQGGQGGKADMAGQLQGIGFYDVALDGADFTGLELGERPDGSGGSDALATTHIVAETGLVSTLALGDVPTVTLAGVTASDSATLTIDSPATAINLTNMTLGAGSTVLSSQTVDLGSGSSAVTITLDGTLTGGDGVGTLGSLGDDENTNLTLIDGAVYNWTSGATDISNHVSVSGALDIAGALTINLVEGADSTDGDVALFFASFGATWDPALISIGTAPEGWTWDTDASENPILEFGTLGGSSNILYLKGLVTVVSQEGDASGDGKVDITDLNLFKAQFGLTSGDNSCDFDGNGRVDLDDFAILRANWGEGVTSPDPTPDFSEVPEPATMTMLMIGGLVALRRRRRK